MSKEGAKSEKLNDYQKALEIYSKAMSYFHKKEYLKAIELFKEIINKYSNEKEVVDRANLYLSICKNRIEGEKIELKTFDDYFYYGIYHLNLGNYEKAMELLKEAQKKDPKEGKVYYALADVSAQMGDNKLALDFLKKAIELDSFFKILAQNEVDFEPLKENKEFQELVK
ncbi:tetratricopeptide repeat protein [Candidatus Aminicenantes bacterium AC-335-K20]|jgi:tetratricopeptide (TPR) repeat protein|nr:tetratricopeptide repeat protein [SCandidatus Aminicenantes bacterium Aminicenantia_JdfR_composite]MCP2597905.1 tetratricopeptide repeat protein [Candidatus Aminicenantes bacterium AC-335-L06]MCP2619444.1 tetratricopeptide repeat protein [Candidatus Aminicenantes bacterium AC-335-K20]